MMADAQYMKISLRSAGSTTMKLRGSLGIANQDRIRTRSVAKRNSAQAIPSGQLLEEEIDWLGAIAQLEPDWDGRGSGQISYESTEAATSLIERVARDIGIRPDAIMALSGDGVQIEWQGPNARAEVEAYADGTINLLLLQGQGSGRVSTEMAGASDTDILQALSVVANS